jgi:hypothetical protein
MNHPQGHQRGETDGIAHVVGEHQEGAAIGNEATVKGDAVHDGGHAEFANTVMQVAAREVGGRDRPHALGNGQVGVGQVRRTTQQFGESGGQHIKHVL